MSTRLALVLGIALLAILLALIDRLTPYRYDEVNLDKRFLPPSPDHLLGTDSLGRDVLTRLLHGFRLSLAVSAASIALSAAIGSLMGISSALSKTIQAVVDPLFNFLYIAPSILIAAVVAFTVGFGLHIVVVAVVLRLLPAYYRIVKTVSHTIAVQPYVEASRAMGASLPHILVRYIGREVAHTVAILSIYSFPDALSIEISLSFIGLGVQPPTPSLGGMIAEGVRYISIAPHIILPPTVAVFTTILILDVVESRIERYGREQTLI